MSKTPEPVSVWLFDCVTLSNFACAGRVELLVKRYGRRGAVTTQVMDEIARGVSAGHEALDAVFGTVDNGPFQQPNLQRDESVIYRKLLRHMGHGESSIIAVAQRRDGTVVTDDRTARATCRELGLPLTGTIGIRFSCA